MRDGDWKLLINPDGSDVHLYNLKTDPGETRNLAVDQPERTEQLWQKICTWALSVGIPTAVDQSVRDMKK